ncbi:MAG: class I SAM-dependent methyltransferase, partial [Chloroflexi bacterium]|nr:class I SAM-dependent methyltransferase [Chloroflexota bacterium]
TGDMVNWDEGDSAVYRALAEVAVPRREEQLATLLCLLPFGRYDAFRIVDLGCGEGVLEYAALTAFPKATALALDGSESMREHASKLLLPFGGRVDVRYFALGSNDWQGELDDADCVVSSLVVHHLTDDGKRQLFREAYGRMNDGGALMLIDCVQPERVEGVRLFSDAYDRISARQSVERTGDTALFDRFVEEKWNIFRHPEPSEMLSPLSAQLAWLADAGFEGVDCFWLNAGYAVVGGYKGGSTKTGGLSLVDARSAVEAALTENRSI